MAHRKVNLPSKVCKRCGKKFAWRKKWRNCWDEVLYCSERCKRQPPKPATPK
ncbi:MAG: DUF2256 domain-containing protein [Planctomycetota bacterium]